MTDQPIQRPPFESTALTEAFAGQPDLRVELHAVAPSTNALAGERARAGAAEGLLVVADHQAAGRGRLDRTWETPPGAAVTFSLLLHPTVPASAWPWIPLLVGHNVAKALTSLGSRAQVKWPNDVLLTDDSGTARKVAGILVERVETPTGPAVVVGVGINVSTTADELPVDTATSIALAAGPDADPVDRTTVLLAVVTTVREAFDVWQAGGPEAAQRLRASYLARCATVDVDVRVHLPGGGTLVGRAVDVDPEGRLVVETADGVERVGAGDVIHVRATA
ncbi:biotin--[acetyl-CoA-carboxylase] ligase [Nocardioides sambongensis]|uniref:biotin--[acetyl-CoA-carboxylase] ligase n=1 Tax=Nocardioides sambongensis TaxID=2589074 RepID=UPI001E57FF3A|nr:biotin--[acetyl-CoA-carboxylase] ligase [Nocardioides sambongensis]